MLTGTNHFRSIEDAERYYYAYGFNSKDVRKKFESGEIELREPKTKEGEKVILNEKEGRYFIES